VWQYVQDILKQLAKSGLFDHGIEHT